MREGSAFGCAVQAFIAILRAFYGVAQLNRLGAANFTEKSRGFIQTL
jgi:hypothetical protein